MPLPLLVIPTMLPRGFPLFGLDPLLGAYLNHPRLTLDFIWWINTFPLRVIIIISSGDYSSLVAPRPSQNIGDILKSRGLGLVLSNLL